MQYARTISRGVFNNNNRPSTGTKVSLVATPTPQMIPAQFVAERESCPRALPELSMTGANTPINRIESAMSKASGVGNTTFGTTEA